MLNRNKIKVNFIQIFAIAEKDFKGALRFKINLIMSYVNPLIQIIFPLILLGQFFALKPNIGPWNAQNFILYVFIGYNIMLLEGVMANISGQFHAEKYWHTLQALMIAPFNRINLLFGQIISHLLIISIPLAVFLIICYIFVPISFITLLVILVLLMFILLIFASIGLIIGAFTISNENIDRVLRILISLMFLTSCLMYPYELFPSWIQRIVDLNPVYYIIDIIRLTWIEDNIIYTLVNHPKHLIILLILLTSLPFIGIYMFNFIFKKFGITGY